MSPEFIQLHRGDEQALADEAAAGLLARPAAVPPKFFYDALGSRLFDAITETPEYYPTRTEAALLARHGAQITAAARAVTGPGAALVDLGAGNCAKAARLFASLQPGRYVAVDISTEFLRQSLLALQREHPLLPMCGVGTSPAGWRCRRAQPPARRWCSTPARASATSARRKRASCCGRHARWPPAAPCSSAWTSSSRWVLEAAYDDALGITAAFNLNLLNHLNRLLGADFDLRQWRHLAVYDTAESRIEMHLQARRSLSVRWRGGQRDFAAGERLHTENSYKWQPPAFEALLASAGYGQVRHWTDEQGWFGMSLALGLIGRRSCISRRYCGIRRAQLRKPAGTSLRWAAKKLR
jgi:uncharacterized SAM-dependent methyltransferase